MNRHKLKHALFVIGLFICISPFLYRIASGYENQDILTTYKKTIETSVEGNLEHEKHLAEEYNQMLYQKTENMEIMSTQYYDSLLDIGGNGVMGSIEIPAIDLNIPIYHGTDEYVLSKGIGHLQGSSLPVGGTDTRAVLTGHRGLPSASLFTRLDELEEGDQFLIHILEETLAYAVSSIEVIRPEDIKELDVIKGKDLVSLVTCTPYGLNTHRLIVTGERIEYVEEEFEKIVPRVMSLRECVFLSLPLVFLVIGIRKVKNNEF